MRVDVMNDPPPVRPLSGSLAKLGCLCVLAWVLAEARPLLADAPFSQPDPIPRALTLADAVMQTALERRADLHAREAAVGEAEARLRLEVANRYGKHWPRV